MDHVGIDVHQKYSEICEITEAGEELGRGRIPTTESSLRRWFADREPARVVLEAGGSSAWVSRLLGELGHEVLVLSPRRVRLIAESSLKTDEVDAEVLAHLSCFGRGLLRGVHQRSDVGRLLQARLRARGTLVRSRTAMVNSVKGILRGMGYRPRGQGAALVAAYGRLQIDKALRAALDPVVEMLAEVSRQIKLIEESLKEDTKDQSVVHRLQTVPGVGLVTSLTYLSWIDEPSRFPESRDVGAYLGLRPRIRRSATSEYRGGITGEGNSELRRLLVQSAHTLLRCTKDSELQRWGLILAERIGKKRAVVAVARKLAVLLHRLWVNGERFRAFPNATAA